MVKWFYKDAKVIEEVKEMSLQKMGTRKTRYPYSKKKMNLHPYLTQHQNYLKIEHRSTYKSKSIIHIEKNTGKYHLDLG